MRMITIAVLLLGAMLPMGARAGTLFESLGGQAGLVRIVDATVERALADPRIKASFEETSIPRLKRLLVEHLCQVSDGGCAYTGRDMRASHEALNLRTRDFNALTEDLQDAMETVGVAFTVQNRLIARLAPMHREIVTR